tara:strand:- start:197 stop:1489 length:1293 start_codon:yes stop_codon:yes gene_type:complete
MIKLPNGNKIFQLSKSLWPIYRSITGDGVRQSLNIIKKICPNLKILEFKSGTKVFDWIIPDEWNVSEAYIIDPMGKKFCNIKDNNLHLVSYSSPFNKILDLNSLDKHLHSIKNRPNSIPYITSYYKKNWGFSLEHNKRKKLKKGKYKVVIKSKFKKGSLTIGEILIKGKSKKEFLISTNICHPSLANNEISGPAVTTYLAKFLNEYKNLRYSYRIIYVPETIGSLTYISKNFNKMKKNIFSGLNVVCVGDNRCFSFLPSRLDNKLIDKTARHVLKWIDSSYKEYSWSYRGSDERQYCAPGIDLPIASIMRSKYAEYPEYHNSDDKLGKFVNAQGLFGAYNAIIQTIIAIENHCYPLIKTIGEPNLSKYNLYPKTSKFRKRGKVELLLDIISQSDGKNSIIDIAEKSNFPIWELYPLILKLKEKKLLKLIY